jgi:putative ubiquitin-RnfH superfamily antitoxin RatB of RatAB toxin-antitoxin module
MENNQRSSILVELCDARQISPLISQHQIVLSNHQVCSLYEALFQMKVVLSSDDPLFLKKGQVGVFGIPLSPQDIVYDGDRIELYRPILIDPKKIRRKKANQNKDAELKTKAKIRKERKVSRDF